MTVFSDHHYLTEMKSPSEVDTTPLFQQITELVKEVHSRMLLACWLADMAGVSIDVATRQLQVMEPWTYISPSLTFQHRTNFRRAMKTLIKGKRESYQFLN